MSTTTFRMRYDKLRRLVDRHLVSLVRPDSTRDLSDGCRYVLSAGGKRIRSILVLVSAEAVGGTVTKALHAAAATEIMHNFTLVHDDIIDNAYSRRGRPTVHVKWDLNYALLVGDVLIGLAYWSLLRTRSDHKEKLVGLFTTGLAEVCEGQALDLSYAQNDRVTLRQYYAMAAKKTARLFSMSAELGGLVGGGTPRQVAALRKFGHYVGRAFQVQDDLLDVIADQSQFGKPIGGDILEGKKTFLLLSALERATGRDKKALTRIMLRQQLGRKDAVARIAAIYQQTGSVDRARRQIRRDTQKATMALNALPPTRATAMLRWLAEYLLNRVS